MKKKKWMIFLSSILLLGIFGFYYQTHLWIWGFNLAKNDIMDVIVYTKEEGSSQYIITDQNKVMEIAAFLSKMDKHTKVEHDNFPPQESTEKYTKILLRTRDYTTYGGSLWALGTGYVQDSNGYYWKVDYEKLNRLLDEILPSAEQL